MARGAWWATVHGVTKKSDMIQRLNNDDTYSIILPHLTRMPLPRVLTNLYIIYKFVKLMIKLR